MSTVVICRIATNGNQKRKKEESWSEHASDQSGLQEGLPQVGVPEGLSKVYTGCIQCSVQVVKVEYRVLNLFEMELNRKTWYKYCRRHLLLQAEC